jgi:hypothetical protein
VTSAKVGIFASIYAFFARLFAAPPSAEPVGKLIPFPSGNIQPPAPPQPPTIPPPVSPISPIGNKTVSWTSGMEVDADGSPRAYAMPQDGLQPLDFLANAGKPGNWYGIITDSGRPDGEPIKQGPNDPCPGYLVSATSLQDHTKALTDPRRYVDSETVPYISVPPECLKQGARLGDVCLVEYRNKSCGAVVADVGPHGKWGEGSIALARTLGIPASPKNGGVQYGVKYTIFLGTSKGWPRTS